jgi:hypothetical protein
VSAHTWSNSPLPIQHCQPHFTARLRCKRHHTCKPDAVPAQPIYLSEWQEATLNTCIMIPLMVLAFQWGLGLDLNL